MDSQRNILLIALVFVSFLLYQQWQADKNPQIPQHVTQAQNSDTLPTSAISNDLVPGSQQQAPSAKLITVTTDVLTLSIDTVGGDVVDAKLNQYAKEEGSDEPFTLLQNESGQTYIAQSGLVDAQNNIKQIDYTVAADSFTLADDQDELKVPLSYTENGVTYTKTFILKRNQYDVDVVFDIDNNSGNDTAFAMYAHLRHSLADSGGSLTMPTYKGGAYSSQDVRYKKYSFDDMKEKNLSIELQDGNGWAAMLQHYFASAWIPRNEPGSKLYSYTKGELGNIGVRMPYKTVASGGTATFEASLWMGPKLQNEMEQVADNLDLVVDYGWLWFLAKPLHWLLSMIQSVVVNWGLAIIILTFCVRGAMSPLTKAQYTSMAKMRMLQPKLQEMRDRIGDDRQRMSQEMMELYKKEKVNPLGGCLPILLQMPIFIALYWSLMESVELRHSPFFGWITDLSAQDPLFILPLLMGASMFLIQKMSPTTVTDPMQKKIMTFMPIMFTGFFLFFPSGLVLYWLVSNIVTLIQQTLIYKGLEKKGLHSK